MMGTSGSRPAGEITDRALAILKAPRKGPLFLWVHFFDTHFPYQVPDDFARATATLPYDAAVGYVDSEVGRLLRALPANTVVAVVSDHGEALGDHGEPTHGVFLFQPTMQVVCLLCGPGVPAGKTSAVACSLADVASSLSALASVPASGLKNQGQDLLALSKAPGRAGRALPLEAWLPFAQFRWMPLLGVTDGRFKWVRGKTDRLYDLDSDPDEVRDISATAPPEALALRDKVLPLPADPPTQGQVVDSALLGLGYAPAPGGKLDPAKLPDPNDRVGALQDMAQGRLERASGQMDRAVLRLKAVTEADPGNPSAWYEYGETLRRAGQTAQAILALDRALAISAQLAEAWAAKGHSLVSQSKNAEAARCYERALALQPDFTSALNPLAAYYLDENKPDKALPLMERAASSGFADDWTYLLRGRVRLVQNRPQEAARDFEAALRISTDPRQTLKAEADAYMVRSRHEEGLRLYAEGIKRYPSFAPNYLTLGSYYLQADQPARAYPLFQKALACDLDPKTRGHVEELVKELEETLGPQS
jgi:tetratricopeptide (TPR) repeat protein